jgi:hypothetical protein
VFLGQRKPIVDLPLPVWERGYRVHGFWLDNQRMGHVGLSPRGFPVVYGWGLDDPSAKPRRPSEPPSCGETKSLMGAKRAVVRAFRHYYSWRFPASRGY